MITHCASDFNVHFLSQILFLDKELLEIRSRSAIFLYVASHQRTLSTVSKCCPVEGAHKSAHMFI